MLKRLCPRATNTAIRDESLTGMIRRNKIPCLYLTLRQRSLWKARLLPSRSWQICFSVVLGSHYVAAVCRHLTTENQGEVGILHIRVVLICKLKEDT